MDPAPLVSTDLHTYLGWFTNMGISAVVGALAGWLGSLWKARILQREQARMITAQQTERAAQEQLLAQRQQDHERQMADLGQRHEILASKVEAQLHNITLVHRVRFEKEFVTYQQSWAALIQLVNITLKFRPSMGIGPTSFDPDERRQKLDDYAKEEEKLFAVFQAQKPFFHPAVYENMEKLLKALKCEAFQVQLFTPESRPDYYERGQENCDAILALLEATCVSIRDRIETMSVIES